MKWHNLFFTFLKQSINLKLGACVLTTTIIMSGVIIGLIDPGSSVWYLLDKAMVGSGVVSLLICTIPIIPYGLSLSEEYETNMMRYYTIRTGTVRYFINKITVSFISGFLTMFLSQLLFVLIFIPFFPLFNKMHTYYAYEQLMQNGKVIKGLTMFMTHMSLSGALMAAAAVFVSTIIPNKFAAISVPVIVYFTLSRIFNLGINLPKFLLPSYLIEGIVGIENPNTELMLKFIPVMVILVLLMLFGSVELKRRIANV